MHARSCIVVIAAGALASPGSSADVLFSNFAKGDSYLPDTGWSVAWGGPFEADIDEAVSFTISGGDWFLDSVEMGIGYLGGPNILFIDLRADDGGVPGAVLESTTIEDVASFGQQNPPEMATFAGTTLLHEERTYWITASTVSDADAWFAWNYNIVEDRGLRAWREDLGSWMPFTGDPRGTFRVNGSAVPGAAGFAMLSFALVGSRPRRRSHTA